MTLWRFYQIRCDSLLAAKHSADEDVKWYWLETLSDLQTYPRASCIHKYGHAADFLYMAIYSNKPVQYYVQYKPGVTRWVPLLVHGLQSLPKHMSSSGFLWGSCCSIFCFTIYEFLISLWLISLWYLHTLLTRYCHYELIYIL